MNQGVQRRETSVPIDGPLPDMNMEVSFMPFFEQNCEYLFPPDFDLNHFLFTPELPETDHGSQSQYPLRYLPDQPDSWMNASHLSGRNTSDSTANIPPQVPAAASDAMTHGYLPATTMESFTGAMSSNDMGLRNMQNAEDWCSQRNSLAETTPPCMTRNHISDAQPARREALLSAVNQLMQVALTMQ